MQDKMKTTRRFHTIIHESFGIIPFILFCNFSQQAYKFVLARSYFVDIVTYMSLNKSDK